MSGVADGLKVKKYVVRCTYPMQLYVRTLTSSLCKKYFIVRVSLTKRKTGREGEIH